MRQSWHTAGTQVSRLAAPGTATALPLPFPWREGALGLPQLGLCPCLQGTGSMASDRAEPVAVETAGDP